MNRNKYKRIVFDITLRNGTPVARRQIEVMEHFATRATYAETAVSDYLDGIYGSIVDIADVEEGEIYESDG